MSSSRSQPLRCLTIGSSDSSGGAGIQGDIKTFARLGCYGMTAVVGITVQNTKGVSNRQTVEPEFVAAQINALRTDIGFDAVKVGATWSVPTIDAIACSLADLDVPIVVDPVLVTAAASLLADPSEVVSATLQKLFPLATVVTPNVREAQWLTGRTTNDGKTLAAALVDAGTSAAIVTGGGQSEKGDWLFDGSKYLFFSGEWHETGATHGSGCAHSAALTAFLASGCRLDDAARMARVVAAAAVENGWASLGGGPGPVNVLPIEYQAHRTACR